ncbi:MAG: hypothetical protein AAGB06_04120 [Verrucomicrobiota bacterium]
MKVKPKLLKRLKVLMYLCFAGAMAMGLITFFEYQEHLKIKNEGVQTIGSVVSDSSLDTGKGRTSFALIIDYKPEGFPIYRKRFVVSESVFQETLHAGENQVTYLSKSPEKSRLGEDFEYSFEKGAIGGGLLFVGIMLLRYFRKLYASVDEQVFAKSNEQNKS